MKTIYYLGNLGTYANNEHGVWVTFGNPATEREKNSRELDDAAADDYVATGCFGFKPQAVEPGGEE